MRVFTVLAKQLFGADFKKARNALFISVIIFSSIFGSGAQMAIAQKVLFLTASVFSAGIMMQMLTSKHNDEMFLGLFSLPFEAADCKIGVVGSFTLYAVLTKSLPVLMLFFALSRPDPVQVALALVFAVAACIQMAAWFCLLHSAKVLGVLADLLWIAALLCSILFAPNLTITAGAMAAGLILACIVLAVSDPYVFYRQYSSSHAGRKHHAGGVFAYFFRIMRSNASYVTNSIFLCALAVFLPFLTKQFEDAGSFFLPVGLGLLLLNTPLCTMISYDRDTEEVLRMMPGQETAYVLKYNLFIFVFDVLIELVYLVAWHFIRGAVGVTELIWVLLFSLQGSIFCSFLEWRFPILNWKTDPDLWHHPRKYIVPGVMMVFGGLLSLSPLVTWIWAGVLVLEMIAYPYIMMGDGRMPARS